MSIDLTQLHQILVDRFDMEELHNLCFSLGVDFDNLRGQGKSGKARELVLYMKRHNQLNRLVARIKALRPDAPEAHPPPPADADGRHPIVHASEEDTVTGAAQFLHIHTGGGAVVIGDVTTEGGDFVGRDRPTDAGPVDGRARDAQTTAPGQAGDDLRRARKRQEREIASLRTQLEAARDNLLLIRERKSQYVAETDIPLGLIKSERQLEEQITDLEAELSVLESPSPTEEPGDVVPADYRGTARPSAPSAAPPGPIQERWALLVGVNQYVDPAIPPLRFCVNDVLALERTLKGLGYTVVALHDDVDKAWLRPTRDNVEAELARMCQAVGSDDLLLVHFACHGKLVDGQPLLVTHETRLPTLAQKALPLAEVEQRMRESQARRLVLTLDACHTGVEIGRDLADPEFIHNAYELAEGFALIAASTAQQLAQEWDEEEHGVFTYFLLEGLSGKADRADKRFVTVDDLKTHVLNGLRRWSVENFGLIQDPTARSEGLGDIILADYRNLAKEKPDDKP